MSRLLTPNPLLCIEAARRELLTDMSVRLRGPGVQWRVGHRGVAGPPWRPRGRHHLNGIGAVATTPAGVTHTSVDVGTFLRRKTLFISDSKHVIN